MVEIHVLPLWPKKKKKKKKNEKRKKKANLGEKVTDVLASQKGHNSL